MGKSEKKIKTINTSAGTVEMKFIRSFSFTFLGQKGIENS